jgi:hypothetical protein
MRDDFHRGELPVSAFSAMQALEDRFGLSPKARRALQWEVQQGEPAKSREAPGARTLRAVEA